jgi:hypothetical protein
MLLSCAPLVTSSTSEYQDENRIIRHNMSEIPIAAYLSVMSIGDFISLANILCDMHIDKRLSIRNKN